MEIIYYPINEARAKSAKAMYSMYDYVYGSETSSYKSAVDSIYILGEETILAGADADKVKYLCDRFSKQLADWYNKGFEIELRCPSTLTTGRSNFPVRKKEKQNEARNKHMEEYGRIGAVKSKLQSMKYGTAIIKSSDETAIEQLQEKVEKLEDLQAYMKAANVYYRKNNTMKGYASLTDEEAAKMDENLNSKSCNYQPYRSCTLTNNNAKLKATKARLASLTRAKEKPTQATETEHFKVVENTEIMRLQLIFDGKPSATVRTALKSNGFHWSPSNTAWQRQLNENAKRAMKYVITAIETETA